MSARILQIVFARATVAFLAVIVIAPSVRGESGLDVRSANGIEYLTGGVGTEERAALRSMGSRFNLELMMAGASGAYVGQSRVRITDTSGANVLEADTDGPFFYAKLSPGRYTVHVSGSGREFEKSADVKARGVAKLSFRWRDQ